MLRPVLNEAPVARKAGNLRAPADRVKPQLVSQNTAQHITIEKPYHPPYQQQNGLRGLTYTQPRFSRTDFARQFARQPGATGAIAPSSKSLARRVIKQADLASATTVVELGPGTGVFTEEIINNLHQDQLFFAIELNKAFVTATRRRCPSACVYHDAASALPQWLEKNDRTQADCIISSIPWTIFDEPDQDEIMKAIVDSLAPGGMFISIIYLGARLRSRGRYFINNLQDRFSVVNSTPTVWQNIPPTQIYSCIK